MRGFLLPLLEAVVVVLVLLLIFLVPLFFLSFLLSLFCYLLFAYNTKANRIKLSKIKKRARKLLLMDGLKERCEWNEKLLIKNRDGIFVFVSYLILVAVT